MYVCFYLIACQAYILLSLSGPLYLTIEIALRLGIGRWPWATLFLGEGGMCWFRHSWLRLFWSTIVKSSQVELGWDESAYVGLD